METFIIALLTTLMVCVATMILFLLFVWLRGAPDEESEESKQAWDSRWRLGNRE